MFGYVRPYKAEMLVREYEQYKSIYCALCREMGKEYGPLSRMTLSYDCTFYVLLRLSLRCGSFSAEKKRCVMNPLKRCAYCTVEGEEWKRAAALSVLLTYQKLKDDIADNGFWKSLRARILLPFVSRWRKKAKKRFPAMDELTQRFMEEQQAAEREPFSFDRCAEPTAVLLGTLFSEGADHPEDRILYEMGYHIGRWVYYMDAADDLQEDLKSDGFNPFVRQYGLTDGTYDKKEIATQCNEVLNFSLSRAVSAMALLTFRSMGPIVENVVAKGFPEMQKEILFTDHKRERLHDRSL